MQRVRIGLTGLAFVFLVVMLAMALTREPAGEEPITPNLLDRQQSGQVRPQARRHRRADRGRAGSASLGKCENNTAAPKAAPPAPPAQN